MLSERHSELCQACSKSSINVSHYLSFRSHLKFSTSIVEINAPNTLILILLDE